MRLPTVGHLHRNARTGRTQALRGVLHARVVNVGAAVEREDLRVGQPLRRLTEDGLLVLAVRDDAAVEEGHGLTLSNPLAIDGRIADRARHLDPVRAIGDLAHRLRVVGSALRRIERDERSHALGDVAGGHDLHGDARCLRGLLRGEDHVLVVRQHNDRRRVRGRDRGEELLGRRVHRRTAAERGRAERSGHRGEALARDDRHDADRRSGCARRRGDDDARRSLVLGGHRVEIFDDDVRDPARGESDANDLIGLEGVDVDLEELFVADHEDAVSAELEHLLAHGGDRA